MKTIGLIGGMTFIKNDREYEVYKYLFTDSYGKDIYKCNEFLQEVNVHLLGTQQRL